MRMVYTSAAEDKFYPARGRLALRFARWARHHHRPANLAVVEALLECRWAGGDGLLGRWWPDNLEAVLLDWFPRRVTLAPESWGEVVPVVRAFVDFLFDQGLTDRYCAEPEQLHAALDKLVEPFVEAMADETRYTLAKFWATRMLRDGIDPADRTAARQFMVDLQAGRIAVDHDLLDRIMADPVAGQPERRASLPVVAVPDNATLCAAAAGAPAVRQLWELVRWVGDGRLLTATGRVRRDDARELVALLDTRDVIDPVVGDRVVKARTEEPYGLSVLVAWARAARLVRVTRGRLVPVRSAAKVLADPLALAGRAFTGLMEIGEAVCRSGTGALSRRFDDAVFNVAIGLYITPEPLPFDAVRELAYQATSDPVLTGRADETRQRLTDRLADNDVHRLLDQLRRLGAIEVHDATALTPLGVGLVAKHLRDSGATVPTVQGLMNETAEVVVATAAESTPETAASLLTAWCANNPGIARAELRALAERTDDWDHRRLAQTYAWRWATRRLRFGRR